ncbi:DNA adenine methylase [Chlorogloeopsis fritschii PCC 9212]|uniref:Site-specific DNA-methyltransferase (adenine-specific) n=1 Tax=Chlorogloeopsis fritschii PCC 6912 TaxID=211165 RepID=A0A433NN61_CHLFR|nr:DNA adenine methylase [Chlorogloeopsis fritschii]RUR84650.1 site-specific DNA-methyltransferase (adenine-specific) [Chlorogloeopsis fritschii PCC 6912]
MLSQLPKQICPRPFLKWAGGKSKLIPQYVPFFPTNYKNYYEPFLGGGAVFFYLQYLQPTPAILTDINAELITTYRCVQEKVDDLIILLKEHQRQHNRDYYYNIRANPVHSELEQAARLIYLNRTCFNGLYRVNSQGKFNVPLGRYDNPKICQEDLLRLASATLVKSEIKQADFADVLNYATTTEDFVFFDPPYYPISNTSYFTAYSRNSFTEKDQKRLRDICAELATRGVKVMVCNSDCEFIKQIYIEIGFNIHRIEAARSINSNTKKRGIIYELLITSY